MSSETQPTPIILCGQTEAIGAGVIEGLKPEYEVVQFIMTTEGAKADIPAILRGQAPANPTSKLGTNNFSRRPVAVVLGGGFRDTFDEIHDAVESELGEEGTKMAWLRHDGTKPAPPVGPEYGKAILKRTKDTLGQLAAEGKLGDVKSGVYYF